MTDKIANYRASMPPEQWELIEEFVRAAITDFSPATNRDAGYFMTIVTKHVHWCWVRGYPLDRQVIFRREVIAEFCENGIRTLSHKTRGTWRSRLFRVSEALMTGSRRPVRVPSISMGPAQAPYTPREVNDLRWWATNLGTDYRRVNMMCVLALGLGAGLKAVEMGGVRCSDVTVDDDGVVVNVREGVSPRLVPVTAPWEGVIAEIASAALRKDQWLLLPMRRLKYHKSLLSNFTLDLPNRPCSVNAQKLRATWIVEHLSAGTPVRLLADAAGLASPDALGPYISHVPDVAPIEGRRRLRSARGAP